MRIYLMFAIYCASKMGPPAVSVLMAVGLGFPYQPTSVRTLLMALKYI